MQQPANLSVERYRVRSKFLPDLDSLYHLLNHM